MRRQVEESSVILGCWLLAFLGFFLYSLFRFPAQTLLARFQWPFIWSHGFLLFMDYCLPVTVGAVALSHSVGTRAAGGRGAAVGFGRLVTGHLGFLIGLAVLYCFLSLGLYPLARGNLQQMRTLSGEASAYLREARAAHGGGDRAGALAHYAGYLAIDPENEEVAEEARQLEAALQGAASTLQRQAAAARDQAAAESQLLRYKVLSEGRKAHELIDLARGFQEKEDWISAHYYYSLAARVDPARADARRLAALAWERINDVGLNAEDRQQSELDERKRAAYTLFDSERYLAAYYAFQELQASHPRNVELATWLERSRRMVAQETFFLDEARRIDPLPGAERLLFLNGASQAHTEVLYIGKMVSLEEGTFFKELECLRFPAGGGAVVLHFTADYGKLMDGAVNLHGVERLGSGGASLPRFITGRLPPGEAPNTLRLAPQREELASLAVGRTTASSIGLLELWQMRTRVAAYGHSQTAVSVELLRRLLLPFSFLVLSLTAVAVGWSNRRRRLERPAWGAYLFAPVLALVALPLTSLYLHAQRVLLNFLLLELGFAVCLVVFLVLQGLLLFSVLVLLAGQPGD